MLMKIDEKSYVWRVTVEIKKETVCEDTLYILREYYHLNTGPLFYVLADDCVWLSNGKLLV